MTSMQESESRSSLPVLSSTPGAASSESHRVRAADREHRIKPPVDSSTLVHRELLGGDFWRRIPAYRDVDEATFLDYRWQMKHSVTKVEKLLETVQDLAHDEFIADIREGFHRAPMAVRVSPYMLSLIDWADPYRDP